ncbi:PTS transporter subunit IIC, partial [Clostridioides difficile]
MVERFGLNLTVIDVGWPTTASATWASPVAPILIPVCLLVNLILNIIPSTTIVIGSITVGPIFKMYCTTANNLSIYKSSFF